MMAVRPWGALFFDIEDTLVSERRWRPGALACLDRLGAGGLRLGIIANTGTMARSRLRVVLPPAFTFELFEEPLVVLSSEVGVEMPDARIFAVALSRAQLPPARTLFVGDDPVDLLAAQRLHADSLRLGRVPRDFALLVDTALDLAGEVGPGR
jgi:FMN phosphatase YigB (HAD superfamily)